MCKVYNSFYRTYCQKGSSMQPYGTPPCSKCEVIEPMGIDTAACGKGINDASCFCRQYDCIPTLCTGTKNTQPQQGMSLTQMPPFGQWPPWGLIAHRAASSSSSTSSSSSSSSLFFLQSPNPPIHISHRSPRRPFDLEVSASLTYAKGRRHFP